MSTADRGLLLSQRNEWNGSKEATFVVSGDTRKSVSGNTTWMNGAPVITKSFMQTTMKLSVTESELDSATTNVQDMLFCKQILESIGLKVKVPMESCVDNQGVRELINNWSVGGRTRHIATKAMFHRELKEQWLLVVKYKPGVDMPTDLFTKNLPCPIFRRHTPKYTTDESFGLETVTVSNDECHVR